MKKFRIVLAVLLSLAMVGMSGCGVIGMLAQGEGEEPPTSTWEPNISGSFLDPTDPVTSVEPSESPVGYSPKETIKSFGMFVRYGNRVFFHVADADSIGKETSISPDYLSQNRETDTMLMCYDLDTCEPIMYFYDVAAGPMALSDATLYYTISVGTSDNPDLQIMGYGLETDEIKTLDYEKILGTDSTGRYMALLKPATEDYSQMEIAVFDNGNQLSSVEISDYCEFIGMNDRYIAWLSVDYSKYIYRVCSADFKTGEIFILGEVPIESRYVDEAAGVALDQGLIDNNQVYLSIGLYEGTGHFFVNSIYLEGSLGENNSLRQIPNENVETRDPGVEYSSSQPFSVKSGNMRGVDGAPNTAGVDWDTGLLGYFDANGFFMGVREGFKDEYFDGKASRNESIELVGEDIFVIRNNEERVPEDDIGWREAYRRTSTVVSRIVTMSGDVERVVSINGNVSLEEGNDILTAASARPFGFASGAGAWETLLYIHEDGTFEGTYMDADMGTTGDEYPNGTVYFANFEGRFGEITQVDDYTYKTTVESMESRSEADDGTDSFIMDGTRYVYSPVYGISPNDEIEIYLPDKPISELSEEFLEWTWYSREAGDTELKEMGLYNVTGEYGFFVEDYADSVHIPIEEH